MLAYLKKELKLMVLPTSQQREPRTADKKPRPVKTVVTSVHVTLFLNLMLPF